MPLENADFLIGIKQQCEQFRLLLQQEINVPFDSPGITFITNIHWIISKQLKDSLKSMVGLWSYFKSKSRIFY